MSVSVQTNGALSATSVDPGDVINNDVIVMGPNDVIDHVIVT